MKEKRKMENRAGLADRAQFEAFSRQWLEPALKEAERRNEVSSKLKALGIPVRPYFSPIHLQPYMQERFGYEPGRFPVTEDLGRRGLAIPFSGKMTREQVAQVGSALRQIFY